MHLQLLLYHRSSLHFTSFSICYYVQQCQILVGKKCIFYIQNNSILNLSGDDIYYVCMHAII